MCRYACSVSGGAKWGIPDLKPDVPLRLLQLLSQPVPIHSVFVSRDPLTILAATCSPSITRTMVLTARSLLVLHTAMGMPASIASSECEGGGVGVGVRGRGGSAPHTRCWCCFTLQWGGLRPSPLLSARGPGGGGEEEGGQEMHSLSAHCCSMRMEGLGSNV